MFSTTIGTTKYLNVIPYVRDKQLKVLKENGWKDVKGYIVLKYKVEGDTALVWKMDRTPSTKPSKMGKSRASEEGLLLDMNEITDTTENLARFVAKAGDTLFLSEPTQLNRVKYADL